MKLDQTNKIIFLNTGPGNKIYHLLSPQFRHDAYRRSMSLSTCLSLWFLCLAFSILNLWVYYSQYQIGEVFSDYFFNTFLRHSIFQKLESYIFWVWWHWHTAHRCYIKLFFIIFFIMLHFGDSCWLTLYLLIFFYPVVSKWLLLIPSIVLFSQALKFCL